MSIDKRDLGGGLFTSVDEEGSICLDRHIEPGGQGEIPLSPATFISLVDFAREVWPLAPLCVLCGRPKVTRGGPAMTATEALKNVVRAWEALPGGRNYSAYEIADWLKEEMSPAINKAREAIKHNGKA